MTSPQATLRNQKLKQFVEEALDNGIFYERDLKDRVIPQVLPFDESVENLVGTFTNPSPEEHRALETRIAALPRGSWAIIHKTWDGGECYSLMFSDGTGKLAVGVDYDHYDSPLPFEEALRQVLGYEAYLMRQQVEAEREIAGDLKAIADNGFALFQKFEGLEFDRRVFATAQIAEIRPNGHIVLSLTLRGSRKRYAATVGGRVLERKITRAKEKALPPEARPEPAAQTALFLT